MRVIDIEQGTDEWMRWRRTHRQASYSPAVMQACLYNKPKDVIAFYRDGKNNGGNAATAHGHKYEAEARAYAAGVLGEFLTPVCAEDGDYGCSLDGLTFDEKILAECKCPYKGKDSPIYENIARYQSPGGYAWQLQHQLMVTGCDRALYVVWVKDAPLHMWVEPDEAKQAQLRAAWDRLWQDVLAGKGAERDDDAWLRAVANYRQAKRIADDAERELEETRKVLTSIATSDCETGGGLRVQKIVRKGAVDYAKVPELTGVDLEPYRKAASTSWRVEEMNG